MADPTDLPEDPTPVDRENTDIALLLRLNGMDKRVEAIEAGQGELTAIYARLADNTADILAELKEQSAITRETLALYQRLDVRTQEHDKRIAALEHATMNGNGAGGD